MFLENIAITVTDEPENTPPTSINLTGSAVLENAPNALVTYALNCRG